MGSKKDLIFYVIAAYVIGMIAGLAGASITVILLLSLLVPPLLLLIYRIVNR